MVQNPIVEANSPNPVALSEDSLISALKHGDDKAAECFVRIHVPWMILLARRLIIDPRMAEDCVKDSFDNAFRKIGDLEKNSGIVNWLRRLVVNQALKRLRNTLDWNEAPINELLPEFDARGGRLEGLRQFVEMPEGALDREELRHVVQSSINKLPDSHRLILQLCDIETLTTREVAEGLGLDEASVKAHLHKARSALKKLLETPLDFRL